MTKGIFYSSSSNLSLVCSAVGNISQQLTPSLVGKLVDIVQVMLYVVGYITLLEAVAVQAQGL